MLVSSDSGLNSDASSAWSSRVRADSIGRGVLGKGVVMASLGGKPLLSVFSPGTSF